MKPVPKTLDAQLDAKLFSFVRKVEQEGMYSEVEYAGLRQELERLAKTDVVKADMKRAMVAGCLFRMDDYEKAHANLLALRREDVAKFVEFKKNVNCGFASEAYQDIDYVADNRQGQSLSEFLRPILSIGAYKKGLQLIQKSLDKNEVAAMDSIKERLELAATVSSQINVSEDDLVNMHAVAGEVLREKKILWQGESTQVLAIPKEASGPSLVVEYFIAVPPKDAALLNWDVATRLIERDMFVPNFNFNFVGTATE